MDGSGHFLSLKVMRVSRPTLASAWQPFYSTSPSFSAHSTASIVSLQGKTPLPGHPKTLRDLAHASELLTLPSSFGSIQLGETFSSCLSVNNEANVDIEGVNLRVEMQTANSKSVIVELGGPDYKLSIGDALEHVVQHEIKELGQHVLACIVTYRLPPTARHAPGPVENQGDPNLQGFRKFYKFIVSNPLSVKTKVHVPRSPSALLSPTEREKVFLEVHIQNMTQDALWFERVQLDCADGWAATDANLLDGKDDGEGDKESLFHGSMALMQPQDVRQYVYILEPTSLATFPAVQIPGTTIPLGRLDLSWRSSFGEPGRLLTSMLSRRMPGPTPPPPQPQQPPSAIPSYLQRVNQPSPVSSPRPYSPQLPPSRPGTPPAAPYRTGSPFRNRPVPGHPHPQSPGPATPAPNQPSESITARPFDIELDLCVQNISPKSIRVEQPFEISFRLAVAGRVPDPRNQIKNFRMISLVVQHLQLARGTTAEVPPPPETANSRFPSSGISSPAGMVRTLTEKLLATSPFHIPSGDVLALPSPYFESFANDRVTILGGCTFLGPSALLLDPIYLSQSSAHPDSLIDESDNQAESELTRAEKVIEFKLSFLPSRTGFVTAGGVRVMLVGDKAVDEEDHKQNNDYGRVEIRTLKELDVIAEVWVES